MKLSDFKVGDKITNENDITNQCYEIISFGCRNLFARINNGTETLTALNDRNDWELYKEPISPQYQLKNIVDSLSKMMTLQTEAIKNANEMRAMIDPEFKKIYKAYKNENKCI